MHESAHSSPESDLECPATVATKSGKHSFETHFPQDRNCEVSLRTKITNATCKRRTGEVLPRAEKFGDVLTADHKVLIEEGESRNNHQYEVVVQDLATQWIQSYPCKTNSSQETEKSLRESSLSRQKSRKSFTLTTHWNLENLEDLSWNC